MMNDQKKPAVPLQETIEELSDAQLSQVNGGMEIPSLPGKERPLGPKLGQALKKPSSFTKSDDKVPSNGG